MNLNRFITTKCYFWRLLLRGGISSEDFNNKDSRRVI